MDVATAAAVGRRRRRREEGRRSVASGTINPVRFRRPGQSNARLGFSSCEPFLPVDERSDSAKKPVIVEDLLLVMVPLRLSWYQSAYWNVPTTGGKLLEKQRCKDPTTQSCQLPQWYASCCMAIAKLGESQ
ncbi:hypothetical protein MUK42_08036 [Musa troglodytarum]|uniref:Uncharacterized protein n=1 Tax=Musa troglodytarum TaxID=320322 RepID=A0A9E7IC28_9LILI|nr:hypothetical protein MUK42_08036 [Musa troglodytarum]